MKILPWLFLAGVAVGGEPVRIGPPVKSPAEIAAMIESGRYTAPLVPNAKLRGEDDPPPAPQQFTPAGQKFQVDGFWYTSDGKGKGHWCAECNGVTFAEYERRYKAATAPRPPGVAAGVPFTPGTPVQNAGVPSTFRTVSYPAGRTLTGVSNAGWYGSTNGCASAGG